jgi:hypothetical protein
MSVTEVLRDILVVLRLPFRAAYGPPGGGEQSWHKAETNQRSM